MKKGQINVQSENIFPIIKKFLYSDHEIFLRELVSNGVDATQKLKTFASAGEFKGNIGDSDIELIINEKQKTLTVKDRGIGMTEEEVDKYINQIAFSSAEEFLSKYKDKQDSAQVIGHFGLGFYSSFMVSKKVEIITKSYKKGSNAVKWECDGSPDFQISDSKKKDRGTEIVLHIDEEYEEFLQDSRIRELLNKYCKFLPVPVKLGKDIINNTEPAWCKKPADLKDEDYKKFYKELYPMTFDDPLFNIHINVDYPFNLTGILYFPKIKKSVEVQKNKIQLYCNQVFVTDSVENIVPDFLTLLHGVIDSPDIPLNVSRSYLQSDSNVKKISSHISKKVADKLDDIFKKERKEFEAKWEDIKVFIEYGMVSDDKFYDRATKFCLFKNTEGKYSTFDDYKKKIEKVQKDKDDTLVYLYSNDVTAQHSFIEGAKSKGYDVLLLDTAIDSHFISKLEQKLEKSRFVRVDSDTADKLVPKDEIQVSKLNDKQRDQLKPIIESQLPADKFTVQFENMGETDQPILITRPEFTRRMQEISALSGNQMFGDGNEQCNLIVNSNHPLISKIVVEPNEAKQKKLAKQATDLALLSQNMLKGEELTKFINRSLELIK